MLDRATAKKTHDMDVADDEPATGMLSDAEKTYLKSLVAAELTRKSLIATALKGMQTTDATSQATNTTASTNRGFTYDTEIADKVLTHDYAVADAQFAAYDYIDQHRNLVTPDVIKCANLGGPVKRTNKLTCGSPQSRRSATLNWITTQRTPYTAMPRWIMNWPNTLAKPIPA